MFRMELAVVGESAAVESQLLRELRLEKATPTLGMSLATAWDFCGRGEYSAQCKGPAYVAPEEGSAR